MSPVYYICGSTIGRHAEPRVVRQPQERAAVAVAPEQPPSAVHRLDVLRLLVVSPALAIELRDELYKKRSSRKTEA